MPIGEPAAHEVLRAKQSNLMTLWIGLYVGAALARPLGGRGKQRSYRALFKAL